MPPAYVKPYIKRGKNDVIDAGAICAGVSRPSMRFVPIKSAEQQSVLMLHRAGDLLIRQRTMLGNALRAHLAAFGIIAGQGLSHVGKLLAIVADEEDDRVPALARAALATLAGQWRDLQARVNDIEDKIVARNHADAAAAGWRAFPAWVP